MNLLKKTRNTSFYIMLFIITIFQATCLFTLIAKADEQYRTSIFIAFGIYILVEYLYFIGARLILKRYGFEVELIAFLLTSIGLTITASVYPDAILKQFIAVVIGIVGFVVLQWFMRELKPRNVEDVIAGISLYRPDPMDFIPQFLENREHPSDISYVTPELAHILDVTFGCIVYQGATRS